MACPGLKEKDHERFHAAWDGAHAMMLAWRAHDGLFGFAGDPRTGHECGDSRYLAIPFFDVCLAERLPKSDGGALRQMDRSKSWLVSIDGKIMSSAKSIDGDPHQLAWLPNEDFARKWSEFVKTGAVGDNTPPPAPRLSAKVVDNGVRLEWAIDADFESGVKSFRIERDGRPLNDLPQKPIGRFGRPLLQTMSYHDTPEQPLPRLEFTDRPSPPAGRHVYRIYAANSVGLESAPAEAVITVGSAARNVP